MMSVLTFACELCGEIHTSEARFHVNKLVCSEIGEGASCLESRAYDAQYDYIKEHWGEQAADKANYGWAVTGDEDCVSIATKVYGHVVLVTVADYETEELTHEEREYG